MFQLPESRGDVYRQQQIGYDNIAIRSWWAKKTTEHENVDFKMKCSNMYFWNIYKRTDNEEHMELLLKSDGQENHAMVKSLAAIHSSLAETIVSKAVWICSNLVNAMPGWWISFSITSNNAFILVIFCAVSKDEALVWQVSKF